MKRTSEVEQEKVPHQSPLKKARFSNESVRKVDLEGVRAKTILMSRDLNRLFYFQEDEWRSKASSLNLNEEIALPQKKPGAEVIVKQVPSTNYWLEVIGSKAYRAALTVFKGNKDNGTDNLFATRALILQEDTNNDLFIGSVKKEGFLNLYQYFLTIYPDAKDRGDDYKIGAGSTKGYRLAMLPDLVRKQVIRSSILRLLCGDDDIHPLNTIISKDGSAIRVIDFEMFGRIYANNFENFSHFLLWMIIYHHKVSSVNIEFINEVQAEIQSIVEYKDHIESSIESAITSTIKGLNSDVSFSTFMPKEAVIGQFNLNDPHAFKPHYPVIPQKLTISKKEDLSSHLIDKMKKHFHFLSSLSNCLQNSSYKAVLLYTLSDYRNRVEYNIINKKVIKANVAPIALVRHDIVEMCSTQIITEVLNSNAIESFSHVEKLGQEPNNLIATEVF